MHAVDVLRYGHLWVLRHVDALPEEEWNTPGVCGVWSCREIIAHLTSFEHLLAEVLNGFLDGGPTPYLDQQNDEGGERFNDVQVGQRARQTPEETMAEYTAAAEKVLALAARIPVETYRQTGSLPWYGMEYDLDDFISYGYYGHKREHMAQIAVFLDLLASSRRSEPATSEA